MSYPRSAHPLWLSSFVLMAASLAQGQGVPGYQGDLYVDATIGNNANGNGSPSAPFRTITKALQVASPGPDKIAIVINPGIYTTTNPAPGTNDPVFEVFPLVMKKNVSLQGTSALNTILVGIDEVSTIVQFNASSSGKYDSVFVDGLTVMTGEIGVQMTGAFPANPTISNCFIVDFSGAGIDVLSDLTLANPPAEHRPKIIHCSFHMSYRDIINRDSTFGLGPNGDFTTANSPSHPCLLNILARWFGDPTPFVPNDYASLMGIDSSDMRGTDSAGPPPNSFGPIHSAFDSAIPGVGDTFSILGAEGPAFFPSASQNIFIAQFFGHNPAVFPDLRLFPATSPPNPAIGTGFLPAVFPIQWQNGTTFNYDYVPARHATLGDFDCEGFGNPRFVDLPDIGADEVGQLIIANRNPTSAMMTVFKDSQFPLNQPEWWVGPNLASGAASRLLLTSPLVTPPGATYVARGTMLDPVSPGNRALRTEEAHVLNPFVGSCFLDATLTNQTYSIGTSQPAVMATFAFGLNPGDRQIFNVQVTKPNTNPRLLSNLQTIIVTP